MKKNRYLTIYSIFVLTVFVLTILWFGISLYGEYSGGYVRSRKTFDTMSQSVKSTLQRTSEYSTDIKPKIEEAIGGLGDYSFIEIVKNGKTVYGYSQTEVLPEESTNMIKLYSNTSKIGENTININAAMYTLRPGTIARDSKIAFIIILIFTLATVAILIVGNIYSKNDDSTDEADDEKSKANGKNSGGKKKVSVTEKQGDNANRNVSDGAENDNTDSGVGDDDETVVATLDPSYGEIEDSELGEDFEDEDIIDDEDATTSLENEEENDEIASQNETEAEMSDVFVTTSEEQNPNENPSETDDSKAESTPQDSSDFKENHPEKISSVPQGLFSPATGFGWEAYLPVRLESELSRAASLESDLILFLIKITNVSRQSEKMKLISAKLLEAFQFNDLIFEYKDDCFAAIKPNSTIDDMIPVADKIHSDILEIVSEFGGECFIGMTSKTIRNVSGERLLKEAESALAHAQEDENSPIIAFRVNADKYREFVDNKTN